MNFTWKILVSFFLYVIGYELLGKWGLVPPLVPKGTLGLITGSEQMLKDYAKRASLTANDVKKSIDDILHNSDFNADDGETDMLERFSNSIESGD